MFFKYERELIDQKRDFERFFNFNIWGLQNSCENGLIQCIRYVLNRLVEGLKGRNITVRDSILIWQKTKLVQKIANLTISSIADAIIITFFAALLLAVKKINLKTTLSRSSMINYWHEQRKRRCAHRCRNWCNRARDSTPALHEQRHIIFLLETVSYKKLKNYIGVLYNTTVTIFWIYPRDLRWKLYCLRFIVQAWRRKYVCNGLYFFKF